MTYEEANAEAKKIFEEWYKQKELIIENAKTNGTWIQYGLDSNNHLFKELNEEVRIKLENLKKNITE